MRQRSIRPINNRQQQRHLAKAGRGSPSSGLGEWFQETEEREQGVADPGRTVSGS